MSAVLAEYEALCRLGAEPDLATLRVAADIAYERRVRHSEGLIGAYEWRLGQLENDAKLREEAKRRRRT